MSVKILAIESSCDETAAAVVEDGRVMRSNVIHSQADLHGEFGGVVPEIASRKHIENISAVTDLALQNAGCTLDDVDAVAVTAGPGLVGALLVGVSYAKAMAYAAGKPLVAVHHIEGHIAASYLAEPTLRPPFLCLVASGGHSHIVRVQDYNRFNIVAKTRDDAAGEAFDKAARVLGLGYPGGPRMDALAQKGDKNRIRFPQVSFQDSMDFSFSGVKTALIYFAHKLSAAGVDMSALDDDTQPLLHIDTRMADKLSGGGVTVQPGPLTRADIAASFQQAVVGVLLHRLEDAARRNRPNCIALSGGVAANSCLRDGLQALCKRLGCACVIPPPVLCTDNAAMIASAGYFAYSSDKRSGLSLNATPYITLGDNLV